jgi:transcriptional regulator of acetoin/glycerol metabolism
LRIDSGRLELHPGTRAIELNDVALKGVTELRPGDQFTEGAVTYLTLPFNVSTRPTFRVLRHDAFLARVEEGTTSEDEVVLLLARSTAFGRQRVERLLGGQRFSGQLPIVGHPASDLLEILLIREPARSAELLKQSLAKGVEREDDTIQWGAAQFPRDGATPEELWAVAVDRLLGLEALGSQELRVADPSMVRLWNLAEPIGRMRRALTVVGEPGVGRETFARRVRGCGAPEAPFVVHGAARFERRRWDEDIARADGGALHIRHPEILPASERSAFLEARRFLPSANVASATELGNHRGQVFIPNLHDRPADVLPIAEQVLHSVDARLARRRSTVPADARQGRSTLPGRENFRTLRNGVIRAALGLLVPELRLEHLVEDQAPEGAAVENLREQLREAERRALEEVLRHTRWNVSQASRLMRIPRRTVVYRMRRLGVRRPGSR